MMEDPVSSPSFARFLVDAKMRTYASGGGDSSCAVPAVLAWSHQLEYRSEGLLYRDIYFGQAHFAGQEVVYLNERPVWYMRCGGGWTGRLADGEVPAVAVVPQSALRAVPIGGPFRGPASHAVGRYVCRNEVTGGIRRFRGVERMEREGVVLYELSYSGGGLD